ncbi:MAG: hypothetical protein KTR29_16740 [Rhodothermaceae bacterium]|nr:hypothetical protein [Rhodothermaceae bacterium]
MRISCLLILFIFAGCSSDSLITSGDDSTTIASEEMDTYELLEDDESDALSYGRDGDVFDLYYFDEVNSENETQDAIK